jgi:GTP-binding protein
LNELSAYNPEMLQKDFMIAISKADMLDEELKAEIANHLPKNIPHLFISSVTGEGLMALKDALWQLLNKPVSA